MRVLVLGAGAGGVATAVELLLAGHGVALFGRSAVTIGPLKAEGISYSGVLGEGHVRPGLVTDNLAAAARGSEVVIVTLPTTAHAWAARSLAAIGWGKERPVILNPGHTGGALELAAALQNAQAPQPPIAEFSTLLYVVRKSAPARITITGRAKSLRVAALPASDPALRAAQLLFPGITIVPDVLNTGLSNVNMVLHPPGAILAAAWVEAAGGQFTFYGDAMTPGVARVIDGLDRERRSVAAAFGHTLPDLVGEMKLIGTVEQDAPDDDVAAAISGGAANRRIMAPDSLDHRYYTEDFGHGLTPLMALAAIAGIDVPVATSLSAIASLLTRIETPRDSSAMGIQGMDSAQLLARVRC